MENEEETWHEIPGFEGLYCISNHARVKSLSHNERLLKLSVNNAGYLSVNLHKNGRRYPSFIHRLMAIVFLGYIPNESKLIVNHINGDRLKNLAENLELVTQRENTSICFRGCKTKSSSIYVGVSWAKANRKWKSGIRINGEKVYLGYFNTETEASEAYQNALSKL